MSACVQCGAQLIERATFCPACGRPTDPPDDWNRPAYQAGSLASFQPPPPAGHRPDLPGDYQPTLPVRYQATSGPTYPYGVQPHLAPHRFAGRPTRSRAGSGWFDAIVAVISGVLVMVAVVAVALMIGFSTSNGPSVSRFIGWTGMGTALAVGGGVDATNSFTGAAHSVSYQLLGPALIGFGLIGRIYVRRLRRAGKPTLYDATVQAGRCAVAMLAALLLVVALSHVGTGGGLAAMNADLGSTLPFGMVTLAITLVIAGILGLSGLEPAAAERVRAIIAGPLRGIVLMFVLANVVTLIAVLIKFNQVLSASPLAGGDVTGGAWATVMAMVVLALPNMTTIALLLGMGVPVSSGFTGLTDLGTGDGRALSVFDLVKQNHAYWIWPLIAALLVVIAGLVAGRRSPRTVNGWSAAPMLAVVLPAALLCLSLMSTGTGTGVVPAEVTSDSNAGPVLLDGVAWGLAGGLIGMALAGRRRPAPPRGTPLPRPRTAPGYPAAPRSAAGHPPALPPGPGYQPALPSGPGYPSTLSSRDAEPRRLPSRSQDPLALPPGPGYPPALPSGSGHPPGDAEPSQLPRLGYPPS